jgi:hypothetical protein
LSSLSLAEAPFLLEQKERQAVGAVTPSILLNLHFVQRPPLLQYIAKSAVPVPWEGGRTQSAILPPAFAKGLLSAMGQHEPQFSHGFRSSEAEQQMDGGGLGLGVQLKGL